MIGLDNVNDYYDVRLKKARLAKLKPFKSFSFTKLDLAESRRDEETVSRSNRSGASSIWPPKLVCAIRW